jgi:hypothetical protein
MWLWSTFLMIGLGIMICLMWIALMMIDYRNAKISYTQVIYPFSATLDINFPDKPLNLTELIKCPDGYTCNIIGAFSQVYDPYTTCSEPSSILTSACGTDPQRCECKPPHDSNWVNTTCKDKNCKIRDVTAYLSHLLNTNQELEYPIGPYPCEIKPDNDQDYKNLPYVSTSSGDTSCTQGKRGYYIHGIYTCIPNNEG